jgi:argininosuccinate lyase
MPQKKNPDFAELIRGKVGRVYGSLIGLLTVMKALPLAYNRDMQEDKVHLFQAVDTTKECLAIAAKLIGNTQFEKDRFEKDLNGDFSLSTELVDYLVRKNVPFRKAHQMVGAVVSKCVEAKIKLDQLPLANYKKIAAEFGEDLFELLTARSSVKNRQSEGSTSPSEVNRQIKFWKKRLE